MSSLQVLMLIVAAGFASVVTLLVRISDHLQAIRNGDEHKPVEKPE